MNFTLQHLPYDAPLRITSPYGPRHTGIKGASTFHHGIDLGRDFGKPHTHITAASLGVIRENAWNDYRGWYVVIRHTNSPEVWETEYQHMAARCTLPVGTQVSAGQVIGLLGNSSNPNKLKVPEHLHFEVRHNGKPVDPEPFVRHIVPERIVEDMTEAETRKIVQEEIQKALAGADTKPAGWAVEELQQAVKDGLTDGSRPGGYLQRQEGIALNVRLEKRLLSLLGGKE